MHDIVNVTTLSRVLQTKFYFGKILNPNCLSEVTAAKLKENYWKKRSKKHNRKQAN